MVTPLIRSLIEKTRFSYLFLQLFQITAIKWFKLNIVAITSNSNMTKGDIEGVPFRDWDFLFLATPLPIQVHILTIRHHNLVKIAEQHTSLKWEVIGIYK